MTELFRAMAGDLADLFGKGHKRMTELQSRWLAGALEDDPTLGPKLTQWAEGEIGRLTEKRRAYDSLPTQDKATILVFSIERNAITSQLDDWRDVIELVKFSAKDAA